MSRMINRESRPSREIMTYMCVLIYHRGNTLYSRQNTKTKASDFFFIFMFF